MPRRLFKRHVDVAFGWLVVLAVMSICGVLVFYTVRLAAINDSADRNHDLICRLDLLFGLDKPLPPGAERKLRPTQREALHQIIQACPELGRKGTP